MNADRFQCMELPTNHTTVEGRGRRFAAATNEESGNWHESAVIALHCNEIDQGESDDNYEFGGVKVNFAITVFLGVTNSAIECVAVELAHCFAQ